MVILISIILLIELALTYQKFGGSQETITIKRGAPLKIDATDRYEKLKAYLNTLTLENKIREQQKRFKKILRGKKVPITR